MPVSSPTFKADILKHIDAVVYSIFLIIIKGKLKTEDKPRCGILCHILK